MKTILLKIAYLINKHYHSIEIKHCDLIKYNNGYYSINKICQSKEIGCIDTLEITAYGISN